MNFAQIQKLVNDLPTTFKRVGDPYTQWIDALCAGLLSFTQSYDSLLDQLDFDNAAYGWLDVWGSLAGIPRRPNESDSLYHPRIRNMILAWRTTPVAIITWLAKIEQIDALLSEDLPDAGYQIQLPATLTDQQIQNILDTLAYVRPAGVPFRLLSVAGGTYVSTVNYLNAPRTTGAYLAGNAIPAGVIFRASTNNFSAILPDLLFTDPLLNPTLAPPVSGV